MFYDGKHWPYKSRRMLKKEMTKLGADPKFAAEQAARVFQPKSRYQHRLEHALEMALLD